MTPGESGGWTPLTSEGRFDEADEIIVCQGCGHEASIGHYCDGDFCPGCREAHGPEPDEPRDIWADNEI